ncbi:MAG: hypothetical protein AAGK14_06795 [Verrucomicrobiota bacterium]
MATRLNILPDERFVPLRGALNERLLAVGDSVSSENFADICEGMIHYILTQSFEQVGVREGVVWLLNARKDALSPSFGIGPHSERLVASDYEQPLREGIVSMVTMTEQPFLENEVYKNAKHSKMVDQKLGQQTDAMIVVPFYFLRQCRGVISCVHVKHSDDASSQPPTFKPEDLKTMMRASAVITELIDYRLLKQTIQW